MESSIPITGLIMAAGLGKRMKSNLPKVLHPVCGLSMIEWVIRALAEGGVARPVVVIGHGGDQVQNQLGTDIVEYVWQTEQKGTGHAVMMAAEVLSGRGGLVVITAGDMPLLDGKAISKLVARQRETLAGIVLATTELPEPRAYGRIVRDGLGRFQAIVEEKDCSDAQRMIREVNPSVYCFDVEKLLTILPTLSNDNSAGEFYLTDVPALMLKAGHGVETVFIKAYEQFTGVNDKWQLSEVNAIKRTQLLKAIALSGVTIVDPQSTHIGPDAKIGRDTVIQPNTVIEGATTIGHDSQIGPNSWIKDSIIGDRCRVFMSHLDRAKMGNDSRCGPFANLRPLAELGADAKIGNFVEIKNAKIGGGTSISHLTYIGDAQVGQRTNIGAGTITCNYDGISKFRTEIGDDVFVGSNSTLVAPVTIGDHSMVAAGSVVTKDVPEGALAIGRGRQENKEEWYKSWRQRKQTESQTENSQV